MASINETLVKVILIPLTIYKRLASPLIGQCCRFYPSCADYSKEAFETHGLIKGFLLTVKRLCRCQPLCKGGIDLVPSAVFINSRKEKCLRK